MKPRPPTMRGKRRYILVRMDPPGLDLDGRDLYYAISESLTEIFGDAGVARIQPSVVACGKGYAIIRCTRSAEDQVIAGLATVAYIREIKVAIRSILTSGTMRSLRQHLDTLQDGQSFPEWDVTFQKRPWISVRFRGTKVDLFEKGFKNQERLFLTEDDLEE